VVLVVVAGCGRIGFAPQETGGDGGPPDTTTTLATGLVAWYPMDALTTTGIADATGNGHDGLCPINAQSIPVCPVVTPGKIGNAIRFDGSKLFEIKSTPALVTTSGFTVTAWIQIAQAPASRACVVTKEIGLNSYNTWALCIEPNQQVSFSTVTGTLQDDLTSTAIVGLAAWHHVAIRWDGTTKTIALDGADTGSDRATTDFDDQSIYIGAGFDGADYADYTGLIDDIRIYDRPLTPAELGVLAQ